MLSSHLRISRRAFVGLASLLIGSPALAAGPALLNVSYDVSREFHKDYNAAFARHWKAAQKEHFDDGGVYDQVVASIRR